jgi:hypothetical protein
MVDLPPFPWTVTMPHIVSGWNVLRATTLSGRLDKRYLAVTLTAGKTSALVLAARAHKIRVL